MSSAIESFSQLALQPTLLKALEEVGYETPSPIQAACIPVLLSGADLLGEAQTGTGKTAAFALPLLNRLDLSVRNPQVLVLTPTRELAIQVAEAFQRYAKHLPGFHVLPVYGGQSMVVQLRQLSRGAHVVVGTPGRIMDHIERKSLELSSLTTLVLDEADEMLRMGFIDDVEWILEHTPPERQTALFSATMPDPIRRVAHRYLREPQEVKIKAATTTVSTIRQRYVQASIMHKLDALTRILEVEEDFDAAIIFVRTKTATVELSEKLEARGYAVAALNGDMTQQLRERVVEQLKRGALDIVVATDVAARGLDVARITHVINYDIPYDTEAYVHRIGRTGRAGRTGTAILFVTSREMRMLKVIERATRQKIEPVQLPSREAVTDRRITQFRQQVTEVLEKEDLGFFIEVIAGLEAESDADVQEIAAALAFLAQRERPLQLPPAAGRDIADQVRMESERPVRNERFERGDRPERGDRFDRGDRPERGERVSRSDRPTHGDRPERNDRFERHERREAPAAAADRPPRENREQILEKRRDYADGKMERYRIDVGRNQNAMPKDIVGAIANEAGIESRFIGQINLYEDYSTVELPTGMPKEIFEVLRKTRIRQHMLNIRLLDPEEADRDARRARPERKFSQSDRPPRRDDGNVPPRRASPPRGDNAPHGHKKPGFGRKG